jgi:hypothetical protein
MRTASPFPGMDPWLEGYWSSVHHRLITNFADQIQAQLPEGLFAEIELTVYINDEDQDRGHVIPDVAVLGQQIGWREPRVLQTGSSSQAVATPYRIAIPKEPIEEGHVVIRSLKDHQSLITAIEVLSPTNKLDRRGRRAYVLKREAYYQAHANVVEIDLLRAGVDLIDVPFDELPAKLVTPYKAVVRRAHPSDDTDAEYYSFPLAEPLPRIAIPLRRNDQDAVLDLQGAISDAYQKGRYGARIDYSVPPVPALSFDDAAWTAKVVAGI